MFKGILIKKIRQSGRSTFLRKMSKIKIYKSIKALILTFLSYQVIAEEFVYGLGDVPIFKDMRSIEDSYIIFDKVDGRYLYSKLGVSMKF